MSYILVFIGLMAVLFVIQQVTEGYYDVFIFIWHLVLSLIFVWPVHWFVITGMEQRNEREQARYESGRQFLTNMQSQGCKIGDYVGTKSNITAVWKCPDGTAHLEPWEAEMVREGR